MNSPIILDIDGKVATIAGTGAPEWLSGGAGNDVIVAKGGDDVIWGGLGNDTICAGTGNDILIGGLGDDILIGGQGSDRVEYGGAPGPVTNLTADGQSTGMRVDLDWSGYDEAANGDDIAQYWVYRSSTPFTNVNQAVLIGARAVHLAFLRKPDAEHDHDGRQQISQLGPRRQPGWRHDRDGKRGGLRVPHAVVVGRHHLERVEPCRQVSVGRLRILTAVAPVLFETAQPVMVDILVW